MIAEQVMQKEDVQWVHNTFECADLMMEKMKSLPSDIHELLLNILKNAARMDNKEAPRIVRDVEMWIHGYFKLTPRDWASTQIRLAQERDPEFAEYQRLKKKFEGGE